METIVNELRTISKLIDVVADGLVNKAFGAQDPVVIHEILPEGWRVYDVGIETVTDLNGSGTRTLEVGVTGDPNAIVTTEDVDGAGEKTPTVIQYRATAPIAITATLTTGTANPTAGVLLVTLYLAHVKSEA